MINSLVKYFSMKIKVLVVLLGVMHMQIVSGKLKFEIID